MGGWAVISGEPAHLSAQIRHFEQVFSVPGVPALHVEKRVFSNRFHLLSWAWSLPPIPDVYVAESPDSRCALVLEGYITELGKGEPAPGDQNAAASLVLERWRTRGIAAVNELNGSFSCAFLDARTHRVTLVTDRFASRSVWFSHEETVWYAGNYPSALASIQRHSPSLNPAGLWSLFTSGRHIGPHGLYRGMTNLQAGQQAVLEVRPSAMSRISYWNHKRYKPERGIPPRSWSIQIADGLRAASGRLITVTPAPHIFLSGGMDSRLAVGALGATARTVTLTSSARNMNVRIAERVSAFTGATHTTLQRGPYWYLDTFEAAALVSGGNYNLRNAHFMVPVQEISAATPGASFMLGDLLENFNKHYVKPVFDVEAGFVPEDLPDLFHRLFPYTNPEPHRLNLLFRPHVAATLFEGWKQALIELGRTLTPISEDSRDCLDTLFRWNNCSTCPTYLMFECIRPLATERNLMFDNDLLDLLLRIPADLRGAEVLHPWTLWHLQKGLALIPDSNYWLPPVVPKKVKKLTKKVRPFLGRTRRAVKARRLEGPVIQTEGSWHMLFEWYRKDPKHRDYIEHCLFDDGCFPPEIFNTDRIRDCWRDFLSGTRNKATAYELDMLLTFGLLHRQIPTTGIKVP